MRTFSRRHIAALTLFAAFGFGLLAFAPAHHVRTVAEALGSNSSALGAAAFAQAKGDR